MLSASNIKLFVSVLLFSLTFFISRDALGVLPAVLVAALLFVALYLLSQARNWIFYSVVLLGIVASSVAYNLTKEHRLAVTAARLAGNWQSESESPGIGIFFQGDSAQVSIAPYKDTVTFFARLEKDSLRLYQDDTLRFSWKVRLRSQNQWQIEQGEERLSFQRKPTPSL